MHDFPIFMTFHNNVQVTKVGRWHPSWISCPKTKMLCLRGQISMTFTTEGKLSDSNQNGETSIHKMINYKTKILKIYTPYLAFSQRSKACMLLTTLQKGNIVKYIKNSAYLDIPSLQL